MTEWNVDMSPKHPQVCKLYTKYINYILSKSQKWDYINANEQFDFSLIIFLNLFFLQQDDFRDRDPGLPGDWLPVGPIRAPICSKIDGSSPTVVVQFFIIWNGKVI